MRMPFTEQAQLLTGAVPMHLLLMSVHATWP